MLVTMRTDGSVWIYYYNEWLRIVGDIVWDDGREGQLVYVKYKILEHLKNSCIYFGDIIIEEDF
jgi:hypothetical protein